ncbi:hypothetical protein ACFY1S_00760 [Micromonospora sp. NPDC000663]|uniref:hypothetical protein n=1 Tax=Micromonospora sp. NPDC000663 TaxID=3364218 RepID=UPI0036CC50C5
MKPSPGTPRWAVMAAWATVACVLPSSLWRTAVGLGVPLGWTAEHLRLERIPGAGTTYVITLSVLSIAFAALTLGLVYRWGDLFPLWLVVPIAVAGAAIVAVIVVLSVVNWPSVSGFADRPTSGWALLMIACYLPAALWPPLLLAVTAAHVRRRRRVTAPHRSSSRTLNAARPVRREG